MLHSLTIAVDPGSSVTLVTHTDKRPHGVFAVGVVMTVVLLGAAFVDIWERLNSLSKNSLHQTSSLSLETLSDFTRKYFPVPSKTVISMYWSGLGMTLIDASNSFVRTYNALVTHDTILSMLSGTQC